MPIYSFAALLLAALWLCWYGIARRPAFARRRWGWVLAYAPAALLFVPMGSNLLLINYAYGLLGALSISTLALMLASIALQGRALPRSQASYLVLCAIAWAVYVNAEGLGPIDFYSWGYAGWQLPALLSALLVLSVVCGHYLGAYLISASVLAHTLGLHPSSNFFDLLFDLPLIISLSFLLLLRLGRRMANYSHDY